MNIISLAVSTFIFNYIIMAIIRVLPLRKKRIWQVSIISILCLGEIVNYIVLTLFAKETNLLFILEMIGSAFGVIIGYVASMMIVLDGVKLFKSKRLKEFERNLNHKEGASVPRNVLAGIALVLGVILLGYGIILIVNFDSSLLITTIGIFLGAIIFIGLAIYFFISGAPQHKTIHAENLLFIVDFEGKKLIYQSNLSKEFTIEMALGRISTLYLIDEYGLIITPKNNYIVKGIKLEYSAKDLLQEIQMNLYEKNDLDEALSHFQKYNRKKIILNEANEIIKITQLK